MFEDLPPVEWKRNRSPQAAARFGYISNGAISTTQFILGGATGNLGFAVEGFHNASDAVSFLGKERAMKEGSSAKSARRSRKVGSLTLIIGGVIGTVGASLNAIYDRVEASDVKTICAAAGIAVINAAVAKKSHSADHSGLHHDHGHAHGAAHDTKLHAITDAATGFVYAAGLVAERWVPGISNAVVAGIGAVSLGVGIKMHRNINNTPEHHHAH